MSKSSESQEQQPWNLSYRLERESRPSWTKHGIPVLFPKFVKLVKDGYKNNNIHLDIGCGNGIKTVHFSLQGFKTIGVDISKDSFKEARELARELGLKKICKFIKANCLDMPFKDKSIASSSDILCFTHLKLKDQQRYKVQLTRVLKDGAYILMVLFSDKDEHFHGHRVSKKYTFRFNPKNPLMDGYAHYHGMYNVHFNKSDIKKTFGKSFDIIKVVNVKHPLYPHRYLWEVILRKR